MNCTPVGMHPHGGSPLSADELNCRIVMDMVYRPREKESLETARRKGIETISGSKCSSRRVSRNMKSGRASALRKRRCAASYQGAGAE